MFQNTKMDFFFMPLIASSLGEHSRKVKIKLETKGYYSIYYTKDEETEIK